MPKAQKTPSRRTWPDRSTESALHPNDELQARPGSARADGKQRRVVHADQLGEASYAVFGDASAEVQNDEAGDIGLGGAGLAVGPVVDEVDGALAAGTGHDAHAMSEGSGYISNHSIDELIELYVPRDTRHWKEVRPLVLEATNAARPKSWDRTREMMLVLTHFIIWAWKVGARDLNLDDLLTKNAVRRFIAAQTELTSSARVRHETHLARAIEGYTGLKPGNSSHENTNSVPYTPAELASWLSVANTYSTERMRVTSRSIIALGVGAGLGTTEMASLRNRDVLLPEVHVGGEYARTGYVLPAWREYLTVGADPDDYLLLPDVVRPQKPGRTILNFLHALPGASVSPRRLRSTWTVDLLHRGIGVQDFLALTAQKTARTLDRYVEHLRRASTPEDIINRLYDGSDA